MACGRTIPRAFALGLAVFAAAFAVVSPSVAEPAKGGVTVDVTGGYARLIFAVRDDIDATARLAGNVLIVSFSQPIVAGIDRLAAQAPDYISAARRDPDGRAVRMALARKVKVNSITAGGKFFVDLLPDSWSGAPPGLPQDVVEELARLAHEAERLERLARQSAMAKKPVPVRVHVASQPTFMRYVFDVSDQTAVAADRAKDRLTLTFDTPIAFDLADAEASLPASVASINAEVEQDSTLVRFSFLSKVDVRTFRDGKSYDVDVVNTEPKPNAHGEGSRKPRASQALETGLSDMDPAEGAPSRAVATAAAALAEKPKVAAPATVAAQPPPMSAAAVSPDASPRPNAASNSICAGGKACSRRARSRSVTRGGRCGGGSEACSAGGKACSHRGSSRSITRGGRCTHRSKAGSPEAKPVPPEAKPVPQEAKGAARAQAGAEPKAVEELANSRQFGRRRAATARQVRGGPCGGAVARRRQPEIVISF